VKLVAGQSFTAIWERNAGHAVARQPIKRSALTLGAGTLVFGSLQYPAKHVKTNPPAKMLSSLLPYCNSDRACQLATCTNWWRIL
jgi:hypothetical protein